MIRGTTTAFAVVFAVAIGVLGSGWLRGSEPPPSPNETVPTAPAAACTPETLGTLGGPGGAVVAVSSNERLVGVADDTGRVARPVMWHGGKAVRLEVPLRTAIPNGVNSSGIVVGTGFDPGKQMLVGWWWKDGKSHLMPVEGDDVALPEAIDDSGHVVGALVDNENHADGPGADENERAAYWPSVHALPHELEPLSGDDGAHAFAIAPDGSIGGVSMSSGGSPVVWQPAGKARALDMPNARYGTVSGFDNRSNPLGEFSVPGGTRAVAWPAGGSPVNLGRLPQGTDSRAVDAANGLVVGFGTAPVVGGGTRTQAMAWVNGAPRVLRPWSGGAFHGVGGTATAAMRRVDGAVVVGYSASAVGLRRPTLWTCAP